MRCRQLIWIAFTCLTLLATAQTTDPFTQPFDPLPVVENEQMLDFSLIVNGRAYRLETVMDHDLPFFSVDSVFRALSPTGLTVTDVTRTGATIQASETVTWKLDFKTGRFTRKILPTPEAGDAQTHSTAKKSQTMEPPKLPDQPLETQVLSQDNRPFLRFDFMTNVLPWLVGKEVSFDSGTNTFFLGKRDSARLNYEVKEAPQYSVLSLLFPAQARYELKQTERLLILTIHSQFQEPDDAFHMLKTNFFQVLDFRLEPSRTTITLSLSDQVDKVSDSFDRNFNRLRIYFYTPEYYNSDTDTLNRVLPTYRPTAGTVKRVILDPGHGGEDEGAIGSKGLKEKDITLSVSYKLAAELKKRGYDVIMTRYSDVAVPLTDRTGLANHNRGDIFVSVHVNASVRKASGAETYYLSLKGADTVSDTVSFENRDVTLASSSDTQTKSNNDLAFILWDMAQAQYLKDSALLAEQIQQAMNDLTGIRNRGVKQANLVVLRGLNMPGVLVEIAFISNPSEEARLATDRFQMQAATAIADSIDRYRHILESRMAPVAEESDQEEVRP